MTQATDAHLCVSETLANLRAYTIVLFYLENVDAKHDAFLFMLPMATPPSVNSLNSFNADCKYT